MKNKLKNIFLVISIIIVSLLSYNYLSSYHSPKIIYPFSQNATLEPFQEVSVIQEIEIPFEMKTVVDYYQESPREDIIVGDYDVEFIVHDESNLNLSSVQLIKSDLLIDSDLTFNDVPLKLIKKNGLFCTQPIRMDEITRKITRNCQESVYYFMPELFLEGNEVVNKLKAHYELKRTLKRENNLEIPFFFNQEYYSASIWLVNAGGQILISNYHNYSEQYTTFKLNQNSYYHIVESESGWTTRYGERIGDIVTTTPMLSKNQESKLENEKLSNNIIISNENSPYSFRILLIPNLKIFLLPLIFLWVPLLFPLLYNKFTTKSLRDQVLILYITILGIMGVTDFNGLVSLNIFYYGFNFFNNYFIVAVYLFPLVYTIIQSFLKKNEADKSSFNIKS